MFLDPGQVPDYSLGYIWLLPELFDQYSGKFHLGSKAGFPLSKASPNMLTATLATFLECSLGVRMKRFVWAILTCLSVPCSEQIAPNTAKPLTQLEHTLVSQSEAVARAQKTKDLEALRRLLTDDFERVGSEGGLHDKRDILDDTHEGNLEDYRLYDFNVLAVDENVAIVTYDAVIQMSEEDEGPAPRYQHFSDVWVKQGDQWRLRFQQATAKRAID